MSFTNQTSHYGLPQYVGSDKPKYLTDFNQAMADIDAQMYENATDAATAQSAAEGAQSTADTATSSISALNEQINGDPTDPSDTGLAGDISGLQGSVNTINSLIGNGEPTTTDKTIIGAINELAGLVGDGNITSKTLAAAATSVEFDVPTTGDNLIDFYVSDASEYTAIDLSVAGKATLTFEASASSRVVYCVIKEV